MKQVTRTATQAFSLVELAIVLVILGLLAGGVLSGQSLIRAAELRSATEGYNKYRVAVLTFQDKYLALPGDMAEATKFWSSAGGTGGDADCIAAQTNSAKNTCNGNGDGRIDPKDASGTTLVIAGVAYSERFLVWKHLANAGLVEGAYTGKATGADLTAAFSTTSSPGTNVPAGKLSSTFYDIYYQSSDVAGNFFPDAIKSTNMLGLHAVKTTTDNPVFTPEEAWNIDTKVDDGSPVYGKMISTKKSYARMPDCTTSDANDATYNLTEKSKKCIVPWAI